jgi:hypothetical protein
MMEYFVEDERSDLVLATCLSRAIQDVQAQEGSSELEKRVANNFGLVLWHIARARIDEEHLESRAEALRGLACLWNFIAAQPASALGFPVEKVAPGDPF